MSDSKSIPIGWNAFYSWAPQSTCHLLVALEEFWPTHLTFLLAFQFLFSCYYVCCSFFLSGKYFLGD